MKKILIAIMIMGLVAPDAEAGWFRCGRNCTVVKQVAVAPIIKTQTTVVNNLIGIPVPVNYTEPITAQGSTIYGYSSVAQAQGNLDLGLLYNQAARLTDQAQQLAGQASTDFASLVQAEGQNRSEVAKILAQGQAARMALEMTSGVPPQRAQQSFSFKVTQGSNGEMKVEKIEAQTIETQTQPPPQGENPEFALLSHNSARNISELLTNKCVSCHSNNKASGNLNFDGDISLEQQRKILDRIVTDDDSKRMPRNADGSAGSKLNVDELRLMFQSMLSTE